MLVRDGWAVHARFVKAGHQTCLAHLLRRCREIREVTGGRRREVPNLVSGTLQEALELRDRHRADEVSDGEPAVGVVELEGRVGRLLARPAIVKWAFCGCSRSESGDRLQPPQGQAGRPPSGFWNSWGPNADTSRPQLGVLDAVVTQPPRRSPRRPPPRPPPSA